jgi:predicted RNase H-like HicB family nuclease
MQQRGRLQNDGGTKNTCRAHEQGAQAGDDPIRGTQVGRTLAPAIEDKQLMPDQHGFGDNGTESTRPRQSGQGDDQMNEYDSEIAHSGNGINSSKTTALRPIWQFAIEGLASGSVSWLDAQPPFDIGNGGESQAFEFSDLMGSNSMDYVAYLHKDRKGGFCVSFADFRGSIVVVKTVTTVQQAAREALRLHIAGMIEDGEAIPALDAGCVGQ